MTTRMNALKIFAACSTLLLAWFARAGEGPAPLAIGSSLPSFELPGVDGKTYTDEDFAIAKVFMIVFTAVHCPTAQAYQERIKAITAEYASQGVAVVAVNPNNAAAVRLDEMGYTDLGDTFEEMKIRAEHAEFNFPYLDDGPSQILTRQFGPIATPHVFVFDKDRKLRFHGRIDDSERESGVKTRDTRNAIDALLAGKEAPVTQTKVFGCSIKWADKLAENERFLAKAAAEPVKLEHADAAKLRALRENKDPGKIRLINTWATWCGPCMTEFDDLVETNLRFRHRDFELVTVAAQFPDEEPQVRKFLANKKASMKNYIFAGNDKYALIEALDPEWSGAIPHTLLVDEKGKVIYRKAGSLDFLELRRIIVPALNAVTPWPGLSN